MADDKNDKPKVSIGGSVTGNNVNFGHQEIGGSLTINGIPDDPMSARAELHQLIADLRAQLDQLRTQQPDDVATVEAVLTEVASTADSPAPPPAKLLQIRADSLKQAAENLLGVAPIVAKIAAALLQIGR